MFCDQASCDWLTYIRSTSGWDHWSCSTLLCGKAGPFWHYRWLCQLTHPLKKQMCEGLTCVYFGKQFDQGESSGEKGRLCASFPSPSFCPCQWLPPPFPMLLYSFLFHKSESVSVWDNEWTTVKAQTPVSFLPSGSLSCQKSYQLSQMLNLKDGKSSERCNFYSVGQYLGKRKPGGILINGYSSSLR